MGIITRFAPSPSGLLHVGNARKALINFFFARKYSGMFLLRIDDTNQKKNQKKYEEYIIKDLDWLGISCDRIIYQSDRIIHYNNAIELLKASGRLYLCYETVNELELFRKSKMLNGEPPIYKYSCLRERYIYKDGKRGLPYWRFKLEDKDMEWFDGVQGFITFNPKNLSDPILVREDGILTYLIASIVDDLEFNVSHIIRGSDHLINTAIQLQIMDALGLNYNNFQFLHFPLLRDNIGEKLSKRIQNSSLRDLRLKNIYSEPLISFLMSLGSGRYNILNNIGIYLNNFNIYEYSKSFPKFLEKELFSFNRKWLRSLDYKVIKKIQKKNIFLNFNLDFWVIISSCLEYFYEIYDWYDIIYNEKYYNLNALFISIKEKIFFQIIMKILYLHPFWTNSSYVQLIKELKIITNRGGSKFFKPLRLSLTGRASGPEIQNLLYILGPEKVFMRLKYSMSQNLIND